jgi:hypothetical protein
MSGGLQPTTKREPLRALTVSLEADRARLNLIVPSPYYRTRKKVSESIDTASADSIILLPLSKKTHDFPYADD